MIPPHSPEELAFKLCLLVVLITVIVVLSYLGKPGGASSDPDK